MEKKNNVSSNNAPSVVELRARHHHDALARINRIAGLKFDDAPESLTNKAEKSGKENGEELVLHALSLWDSRLDEDDR